MDLAPVLASEALPVTGESHQCTASLSNLGFHLGKPLPRHSQFLPTRSVKLVCDRTSMMSTYPSGQSFVQTRGLSLDVHGPLLSWIFGTEEFEQWLLRPCTWQLCFVGGPGSGKTTLSTLTTNHLRDEFKDQNVCVASIFVSVVSSVDAHEFVYQVLSEIWRQLSISLGDNLTKTDPQAAPYDRSHYKLPSCGLESLRDAIYNKLSALDRAFLVFDDVDLLDQSQHEAIEIELVELGRRGMNIMTTTRLSMWHKAPLAACDNCSAHQRLSTCRLYWCCTCRDGAEDVPTICQPCKDGGYICSYCGQTTDMYEPYHHIDLSLECDEDVMADYVATSLELVHGDLRLGSSAPTKPPLSRLGRALGVSQDGIATTARQLRDKIVQDSEGNIAMANIRLEECEDAKSVEEVVRYGDRLPGAIVALFDAGITKIQQMPPDVQELGLKAIVGVAVEFHDEPFEELERWLRRQLKSEWLPSDTPLMQDSTIERVLRAAGGFLVVDKSIERLVGLYHSALGYYSSERYNESLFWIHTSINTINRLESDRNGDEDPAMKRPMRTQTWHPATRKMAYTRTA